MLRAAHLPRSQPVALNFLLVSKRWQKTPPTTTTNTSIKSPSGSTTTSNPSTTFKAQTTAARPSFDASTDRTIKPLPPASSQTSPPPGYPRSGGSGGGGVVKAIVYGVALGLTATLVYAEYENGPFRRKLESTVPFSSTVLGGLDQFIDPAFGRTRKSTSGVPEKYPDLAYVKDKEPVKKLTDQVKSTVDSVREKLPDKATIQKAGEQVKDAVSKTAEKLPDPKKVKAAVTSAADQVSIRFRRSYVPSHDDYSR